MQLRYIDDILETIEVIKKMKVVPNQHSFIEGCHYYNNVISDALKKIKDEYLDDPQSIQNYSDIELKLILNQIDQLKRDFAYEIKNQNKILNDKENSETPQESFHDFIKTAKQTMKEIELALAPLGLDIKIVYATENFYQFDEIYEQFEKDLPENEDFFENKEDVKIQSSENLISKRFWLDNFGEPTHVDFSRFFEKFKTYVLETEKKNIDDSYYNSLGKFLDISWTIQVFSNQWNEFFEKHWSNYSFRKKFLLPQDLKSLRNKSPELQTLTLEYFHIKNETEKHKMILIKEKEFNYSTENDKLITVDLLKKPLTFGRKTKAFKPDYCFAEGDNSVSNKQFHICAYRNGKETDGYYVVDLSSTCSTEILLKIGDVCFLDEGNLLIINNNIIYFSSLYPRYKLDDPELQQTNSIFLWSRFPYLEKNKAGSSYIEIKQYFVASEEDDELITGFSPDSEEISVFIKDQSKEEQKNENEDGKNQDKAQNNINTDLYYEKGPSEAKSNKIILATIKFQKGKWCIQSKVPETDKFNKVIFSLCNKEDFKDTQGGYGGLKLRNNTKIYCSDHIFKVKLT